MTTHIVIPDTQVKPGVPVDHLHWIGQYIVDKYAGRDDVRIIHLGDHWDMPSLSSYDKGKKAMEGRRVDADIEAGNEAFRILDGPQRKYNERLASDARTKRKKFVPWNPPKHLLRGNHEDRINRACEDDASFDGLLSMDLLESPGWEIHDFLVPVELDGVHYAHYFANPMSGRPYGGSNIETRLKTIGASFTMGHQQGLWMGMRYVMGRSQHGLVAGACLAPHHRVLTADLRYIPLGDLEVGQELVSFDEDVVGRRTRRFKTGTVRAVKIEPAEVFDVHLDDGTTFTVTADHRWLTRLRGPAAVKWGGYAWRETRQLRNGSRTVKPLPVWDTSTSFDHGWLSGIYDGEGCYTARPTTAGVAAQLQFAQNPGPVLDRAVSILSDFGTGLTFSAADRATSVRVKGGTAAIAHVLGALRPGRLLNKFSPDHLGRIHTNRSQNPAVVAIEPAGVQDIVQVDVDAGTMIVDGFAHHNCYLHDEDYRGPQGNAHWRGIVVCHGVDRGSYDVMTVSLDYLCRRYEGVSLAKFKPSHII